MELERSSSLDRGKASDHFHFQSANEDLQIAREIEDEPYPVDDSRSLCLFTSNNRFRKIIRRIVLHPYFEYLVLTVIIVNCIAMALTDPLNEDAAQNKIFELLEIPFATFFLVECFLKIIALGLIVGKGAYLRDRWNILDFLISLTGTASFTHAGPNLTAIRTLRILRSLGTLKRLPDMRRLVTTLLISLPQLVNVIFLIAFIFLLFSIFGVQAFSGALHGNCFYNDTRVYIGDRAVICGHYKCTELALPDGQLVQGECIHSDDNENPNHGATSYDNIFWALLTTFQVVTLEGWVDVLYMVQDGATPHAWMYFVLLVLFGAFFLVNLMLAVISYTFKNIRDHSTRRQRTKSQMIIVYHSSDTVFGWVRGKCLAMLRHPWFNRFTMVCILLNTVIMMMSHYNEPERLSRFIQTNNTVFTFIFLAEVLIKWTAFGIRPYFSQLANSFDFFVVIASLLPMLIPAVSKESSVLTVFRMFRLLRVFRLISTSSNVRKLLDAVSLSVSPLLSFAALMLLFIFVYAVVGMSIYAGRFYHEIDPITRHPIGVPRANFDSFLTAFATIFQIISGEAWHQVLYDAINCCTPVVAVIFFCSAFVMGNYILLNLFLAILLSNFERTHFLIASGTSKFRRLKKRVKSSLRRVKRSNFRNTYKAGHSSTKHTDRDAASGLSGSEFDSPVCGYGRGGYGYKEGYHGAGEGSGYGSGDGSGYDYRFEKGSGSDSELSPTMFDSPVSHVRMQDLGKSYQFADLMSDSDGSPFPSPDVRYHMRPPLSLAYTLAHAHAHSLGPSPSPSGGEVDSPHLHLGLQATTRQQPRQQ